MTINSFYSEYSNQVLLSQYHQQIDSILGVICEARSSLAGERRVLDRRETLQPADCDDIMSVIRAFLSSVGDLEKVLKASSELARNTAAKSFKILISLNQIKGSIQQLMPALSAFRKVCLASSRETYQGLDGIRRQIDHLLDVSEALEPETREILANMGTAVAAGRPRGDYIQ